MIELSNYSNGSESQIQKDITADTNSQNIVTTDTLVSDLSPIQHVCDVQDQQVPFMGVPPHNFRELKPSAAEGSESDTTRDLQRTT